MQIKIENQTQQLNLDQHCQKTVKKARDEPKMCPFIQKKTDCKFPMKIKKILVIFWK